MRLARKRPRDAGSSVVWSETPKRCGLPLSRCCGLLRVFSLLHLIQADAGGNGALDENAQRTRACGRSMRTPDSPLTVAEATVAGRRGGLLRAFSPLRLVQTDASGDGDIEALRRAGHGKGEGLAAALAPRAAQADAGGDEALTGNLRRIRVFWEPAGNPRRIRASGVPAGKRPTGAGFGAAWPETPKRRGLAAADRSAFNSPLTVAVVAVSGRCGG